MLLGTIKRLIIQPDFDFSVFWYKLCLEEVYRKRKTNPHKLRIRQC